MKRILPRLLPVAALMLSACQDAPVQVSVDTTLCDFSQGQCDREGLSLSLSPSHAPSEHPLDLALDLPQGAKVVSARIEGRDMFMGQYPVQFDAHGKAEVMYGSCASDYMVWRLWLTLENDDGTSVSRHFDWRADVPL